MATYTYNALNQRIGVKDSGTQTWTVYDGTSADANPYADFNGSGTPDGALPVRPGRGQRCGCRRDPGADQLRRDDGLVPDRQAGLGARHRRARRGHELDHIVYDSFGNIVTETNASNGDRFKFAGMQYDATTGQYYDHARWYYSGTGRFTILDPDGFAAGEMDLYGYAENSPANLVDPSGQSIPGPITVFPSLPGFSPPCNGHKACATRCQRRGWRYGRLADSNKAGKEVRS